MYKTAGGRFDLLGRIRSLIHKSSAEKICKALIQPVFTYCGTLGHVPVKVELKTLNVEVRKSLVEIIKSRQGRVPASLLPSG